MAPTGKRRATVLIASGVLLVGAALALAPVASAAVALTASYVVTDDWGTGYAATYTVRNSGTTSASSWKVEFDLPSTTTVRKYWTAGMTHSGTHWVFTNLSYNATVAAGGTQTFGFNTNGEGRPSNCLVNGVPCSGAAPSPSPSASRSPSPSPSPTPSPSPSTPPPTSPYARTVVSAVTASTNGNNARYAIDDRSDTAWSASGDGQWLTLDLGKTLTVGLVDLAFQNGDTRRYRFDLQVSTDGTTWTTAWSGNSSGTAQTVDVPDTSARYVRYLGHGNSVDANNAVTEVHVEVLAAQAPHPAYANGDAIPDFSHVGYAGGGVALPTVPVKATVTPVTGDAGATIQAAIDTVSGMTPDPTTGFRGTVVLKAGTYDVAGSVTISTSGVVLRGEGDGPTGTIIHATGTSTRTVIRVQGSGSRSEVSGTRQAITSAYIPVGARTLTVANGAGFHVGDEVVVERTPNQDWIDATGMDSCTTVGGPYDTADVDGSTCLDNPWTPTDRVMDYERKITAVNGNTLTFDTPMVEAIQSQFGGGSVFRYTYPGRINHVGVEYLRSESDYASDTDENHANRMVAFFSAENSWARNLTSRFFVQGTFEAGTGSRYITIQDSSSLDHKSQITGGRRYAFDIEHASNILVMRCYGNTARHDFVTGDNTPGPNVFFDSRAEQSYAEVGPHQRWATGALFDNIVHRSVGGGQILGAYNRGNQGTGHGWAGAYIVFYNCLGDVHRIDSPPYARNWSIGCRATTQQGGGEFDSYGKPVGPWSLYLQQLQNRLGGAALANIGY
jgi:Cellulose binding domain/F5/8 type C domain